MAEHYLSWLDNQVLETAAQYVVSHVQAKLNRRTGWQVNELTQRMREELIPGLDFSHVMANDSLERAMQFFHTRIISSLPGWSTDTVNGVTLDLMHDAKNMYVELKGYFRYDLDIRYLDRLATLAQKHPAKRFYIVYVDGTQAVDAQLARDHLELVYPQVENLVTLDLPQFYAQAVDYPAALDELTAILPAVLRRVTPKPLPHVFISYSRRNLDQMKRLKLDMIEQGLPVWTDELLQPGTPDWQIAIERALETAACVLLILSPESKTSEWVRNELNYARENGVQIIPYWLEGESHEVSMLNLVTTQRIDARQPEFYQDALAQVVSTVQRFIGIKFTSA